MTYRVTCTLNVELMQPFPPAAIHFSYAEIQANETNRDLFHTLNVSCIVRKHRNKAILSSALLEDPI